MNLPGILALYNAEVRARPIARAGFTIENEGGLVCLTGPFRFVSAWPMAENDLDAAAAAVVSRARRSGTPLFWRLFDHDNPAVLPDILTRHGLVPDPPGTLMVFDLERALDSTPATTEVRRATTPKDVDDYLAVMDAVFNDDDAARMKTTYDALLDDPTFCLFTAYADGQPVAAARLETGPRRQFGALFGGGVRPAHRGQGLYRALVHARAAEARRLGLRYLTVEALETSRPILERMGFIALAQETTWMLPAA